MPKDYQQPSGLVTASGPKKMRRCRRSDFFLLLLSICSVLPQNGQGLQTERLLSRRNDCGIRTHSRVSTAGLFQSSSSVQQSEIDRAKQIALTREDPRELEQRIVSLGRKGFTDEALNIYDGVSQPTVRLMNSAIDACARARPTRLDKAFHILEEAETSLQPNVFTFGALMSACARAKRGNKAIALLKSMQVCIHLYMWMGRPHVSPSSAST
jgi:pentatricopeptide repeat protein